MHSLSNTKLIFSDVDETVAGVYLPATDTIVEQLSFLLQQQIVLVFISGQSKDNIFDRVIKRVPTCLRQQILICECSGAAVWSFEPAGNFSDKPVYSLYDAMMTEAQKKTWRTIVAQLTKEFAFIAFNTMPKARFIEVTKADPTCVMLEDRGSQITFELVNCESRREQLVNRANELFASHKLPLDAHVAGTFAIDFTLKGVDKSFAVRNILENGSLLRRLGLPNSLSYHQIMVWGDKFSLTNGGTDMHILHALDPRTPVIDFRHEPSEELDSRYNIMIWNGEERLHYGLEEYLCTATLALGKD